jgi:glycosyltransferase involved in cell wall biosynthesis
MIYVCVPIHNEARTAGLVLWKVRQVFTAFSREYTILACDDASTDETAAVLARYARVLPLEVITHRERVGYARSLEELLRLALQRTDRPKRDCAITLHADFVHNPEIMEEMVKRLESGADLVVAEETGRRAALPLGLRWARRWAPRLLPVSGVRDALSGFTALRLVALRQALRGGPEQRFLTTEGWCANAELVARLAPHARRLDTVAAPARYDLRQRPSRVRPLDALVAAWRARRTVRAARTVTALIALMLIGPRAPGAQTDSFQVEPTARLPAALAPAVAFPTGERMVFNAKYGLFNVGKATLEVTGRDTVGGVETVRLRFHIHGGALWYQLDQDIESWVGLYDFRSRRFRSSTLENDKQRIREYRIFPDSGFYREVGKDSAFATVAEPLDDASFFYWIRTTPLVTKQRYEYSRYFRPDRNPVILEVLKREKVNVANRKWNAIVVRVVIPKGRGIFAEKADTRLWLSDDDRRVVLALQSSFSFGTVTLKLKEYTSAEPL